MHCLSSSPLIPISISAFSSLHFQSLGFLQFNPKLPPLRITPIRSRHSSRDQLSLPDNEFELESGAEDEDDEEDDDFEEEYEDDDIAADEYTIDADDASEEEEEEEEEGGWSDSDSVGPIRQSEEKKAERVKKLLEQVREFGAEIIDYQEVAGIYNFPIDRFQVDFLQSL